MDYMDLSYSTNIKQVKSTNEHSTMITHMTTITQVPLDQKSHPKDLQFNRWLPDLGRDLALSGQPFFYPGDPKGGSAICVFPLRDCYQTRPHYYYYD